MSKHKNLYVVIGSDKGGKPRAARYHERDGITVAKAAALTGFRIARASSVKAKVAAKGLPEIQLFSSGRALVPRVRRPLFEALNQVLTFPAAQLCKTSPGAQKRTADVPVEPEDLDGLVKNPWASVKQGSLVLAEEPEDGGWFEAVVVGQTQKGALLSLRWRDWPKLKMFTVPRTGVAIPPSGRPPLVRQQTPSAEAGKDNGTPVEPSKE